MKVGDKVKLTGKTKHGKNRVREQGEFWTIAEIRRMSHSRGFAPMGTKIILMNADSDPLKHWRWVEAENDKNFDVKKVSESIQ
tara:strand:- start:309 stop:557 length:249 start_codon:yes stop_codon:yes gene_type:complete